MILSRLSVRRPILMTMFIGFFVVLGLLAWPRMPVELLPPVEIPYLLVTAVYPGAGPEDVESAVLVPMEDALGQVGAVTSVRSSAAPDAGTVVLQLQTGADVDAAIQEVRAQLDAVDRELPAGVWQPTVQAINLNAAPVLQLAVTGARPLTEITAWVEDELTEPLARIEGVSAVDLVGARYPEVHVDVDQGLLLGHHLTLGHVVEAVRAGGTDIPGGTLADGDRAAPVRLLAAWESAEDLRGASLQAPLGEVVRLDALAVVREGVRPDTTSARIHGAPAVGVSVYKRADANTVALGEELTARLAEIRAAAPDDVQVHLVHDASVAIRASIDNLVGTLALCIGLTALILWFFLHDLRGTAIVAVSIPASLVGSLAFVYLSGFTVNYMTLMGLAITVGTLVDASIVVLESIAAEARAASEGLEPGAVIDAAAAANRGTGRVFLGVIGSTITNVAVFTPMAFMEGIVGQFFTQFALTVSYSMLLSLLMSFTLTPMLASFLYRRVRSPHRGPLARAWDWAYRAVEAGFRDAIRWSLGHRLLTVSGLGLLFGAGMALLGPLVSLGWFTTPDQGFFMMRLWLPRGTDLAQTSQAVQRAEAMLYEHPQVRTVYAEVGRYQTLFGPIDSRSSAELHVVLAPGAATADVMGELRPHLIAQLPGTNVIMKELGGGESAIRDDFMVDITGPDPDVLAELTDRVVAAFEAQPNVSDVATTGREVGPEIRIRPNRQRLAEEGLTAVQLGKLLRVALVGDAEAVVRTDADEIPVRVRLREHDRDDLSAIASTTVQTPGGAQVPLRELARVEEVDAPVVLSRKDRARMTLIRANLAWGTTGDTKAAVEAALGDPPDGYEVSIGGEEEQRTEAVAELSAALGLAVLLTWMLLSGLLESFSYPLAILSTLPLALIGVLLALAITGVDLDIFGMMAVVMLLGIVVNNAILMVEETRHQLDAGEPMAVALERGALLRLRPILMTSLSTVVGMIPLALALGPGSELRQAMALVSVGGVAVSSVLVLVAAPVLLSLIESARSRLRLR